MYIFTFCVYSAPCSGKILVKIFNKAKSGCFPYPKKESYFRDSCIFCHRVILMKQAKWKTYVLSILLTEAVGALSGWLTREAAAVFRQTVNQPPLSPPAVVFPIVWGILYALMGISAARISLSEPSPERSKGLNLYVAQLIVNFFWSLIFFNAEAYGFAFLWLLLLWGLVLWMILTFRRVDPVAAWLQIPYLIWLTFAAYLNFGVWSLNR